MTIEEGIKLSTLIFQFKALLDQHFPKHLQLCTTISNELNNNNEILTEVTKNSGTFANECEQSFNDLAIIIWCDIVDVR